MAKTTFSQGHLDELNAQIAAGNLSISYRDFSRTFYSLDEMLKLRAVMQAEIDSASGSQADRHILSTFDKGYQ